VTPRHPLGSTPGLFLGFTPELPLALTPRHPHGSTPGLSLGFTLELPLDPHPCNSLCLGREPKARVATNILPQLANLYFQMPFFVGWGYVFVFLNFF